MTVELLSHRTKILSVSASKPAIAAPLIVKELCGACGLCCNGAIFADVELRSTDDEKQLRLLGLQIKRPFHPQGVSKFLQPCVAHDGCKCGIYSKRPEYCRAFECAILKNVCSGAVKKTAAMRIIREAKNKLAVINDFLMELGNGDETISHRVRFKQMSRGMKDAGADQAKLALFGELTVAVHELNVLLAKSFYPGQ